METSAKAAVCVALLVGGFAASAGAGQKTGPASPPPVIESLYGPDLYRHYCATCHGRDGKGDGPAGRALKVPPSDLTVLARREKGVFPASAVETSIRGGARVKVRIAALVSHIATIQQK